MSDRSSTPRPHGQASSAALVALVTAVAAYLPAVFVYDHVSRWISPIRHAEEMMGRGIAAMLIGGPLVALAVAGVAGWIVYRRSAPGVGWQALALVAACVLASITVARWAQLL